VYFLVWYPFLDRLWHKLAVWRKGEGQPRVSIFLIAAFSKTFYFILFPATATIEKVCGFSEPLTYYLAAAGII